MNSKLKSHPSIASFIAGIKEISEIYLRKLENIKQNRKVAVPHPPIDFPTLPSDFESWETDNDRVGEMRFLKDGKTNPCIDLESSSETDSDYNNTCS